jgi:ribose 5-phosphate isomerase B
MVIYIGADHRGFKLKEFLKNELKEWGYETFDVGANSYVEGDDFPDYAKLVGERINIAPDTDLGVLICGSGFGMDIAVNKYKNVRAAIPSSTDHIYDGRHDDNVNTLIFGADFIDEDTASKILKVFLETPFSEEAQYIRRLEKIKLLGS